jgi:hypothetical protein
MRFRDEPATLRPPRHLAARTPGCLPHRSPRGTSRSRSSLTASQWTRPSISVRRKGHTGLGRETRWRVLGAGDIERAAAAAADHRGRDDRRGRRQRCGGNERRSTPCRRRGGRGRNPSGTELRDAAVRKPTCCAIRTRLLINHGSGDRHARCGNKRRPRFQPDSWLWRSERASSSEPPGNGQTSADSALTDRRSNQSCRHGRAGRAGIAATGCSSAGRNNNHIFCAASDRAASIQPGRDVTCVAVRDTASIPAVSPTVRGNSSARSDRGTGDAAGRDGSARDASAHTCLLTTVHRPNAAAATDAPDRSSIKAVISVCLRCSTGWQARDP